MIRKEFQTEERLFPFVAYFPKKIDGLLPLVVQLHGAGERGNGENDLEKVDIHGFSKYLKQAEHDCIVIMPQCPSETFWAARVESIVKFIEQIIAAYDIDPDRVCLTGLSMGGYGTWFTAMARPDLFAAIAPICGGGMAWNAGVLTMPVWAFHGVEDDVVTPVQSDEMVAKLKELDRDVTYSCLEGVGHGAWEYACNQELMEWLLSKHK